MRDYDGKFCPAFDQVFKDRSIQVKLVGPQAPNLNAFIERWIQSLQQEALDHFICFGQEHFDHIVSEYVTLLPSIYGRIKEWAMYSCRGQRGGPVEVPRR